MDKWEYDWYTWDQYAGELRFSDGTKMNWEQLWAHFDKLGSAGWEMVSATPLQGEIRTVRILFVLKRRLSG